MVTIKNCKGSQFKSKLDYWSSLTEDNMHGEALVDIAMFFEYAEFLDELFELMKKESLTIQEYERRSVVEHELFVKISDEHGDYIAEVIKKNL